MVKNQKHVRSLIFCSPAPWYRVDLRPQNRAQASEERDNKEVGHQHRRSSALRTDDDDGGRSAGEVGDPIGPDEQEALDRWAGEDQWMRKVPEAIQSSDGFWSDDRLIEAEQMMREGMKGPSELLWKLWSVASETLQEDPLDHGLDGGIGLQESRVNHEQHSSTSHHDRSSLTGFAASAATNEMTSGRGPLKKKSTVVLTATPARSMSVNAAGGRSSSSSSSFSRERTGRSEDMLRRGSSSRGASISRGDGHGRRVLVLNFLFWRVQRVGGLPR